MITSYKTKEEMLFAFAEDSKRQNEIAEELLAAQPHLGITAYIIAGDMLSAEKASKLVREGMAPEKALHFIGSYARFDWAVEHLDPSTLLRILPELWRGADPDDTNPEYLKLWEAAWKANNCKTVCDGQKLPRTKKLTIYRGQASDAPIGFAWTLDVIIARKFALSGGLRGTISNGKVLEGKVDPFNIYGYVTGRGESEIIVDPKKVEIIK
jgi:hypothetical protein